jgi:predicted AlkP superfamily phosphohydrolase/phosphomutase
VLAGLYLREELYRQVRACEDGGAVAPDLLVYFGNLRWRSIGSFGLPQIYTFENDMGPDDANHDQDGVFVLWDPRNDRGGRKLDGLQLMDVTPTALSLLGVRQPAELHGKAISL